MKEYTITYTGTKINNTMKATGKSHADALQKAAIKSLGKAVFDNECCVREINPSTYRETFFIVSDGATEKYFRLH